MSNFDDSKPPGFQYPGFNELYPGHTEQMEREIRSIGHAPFVELVLKVDTAMSLLAGLQLLLRHPDLPSAPETIQKIQTVASALELSFARYPALAAMAAAGWDAQQDTADTERSATPDDPIMPCVAVLPEQEAREITFWEALDPFQRDVLEQEAQALMPPALREKLEAHYAAGQQPGLITGAALDKARSEAVRRRMRHIPND